MKAVLWIAGALVLFALASSALWHTVGGLVEQAGAREERTVSLDVRITIADRDGTPVADAPVRLVIGRDPQMQPSSAGQAFVTDARGSYAFATRALIDRTAKTRPTNFVHSLFAASEQTDHVSVGAELSYLTYRWLYVADLYRFPNGDVESSGLSLYTRDAQGAYSRKARYDGSGWTIADLGAMRLTTAGYRLDHYAFDQRPAAEGTDAWMLALAFVREAEPVIR